MNFTVALTVLQSLLAFPLGFRRFSWGSSHSQLQYRTKLPFGLSSDTLSWFYLNTTQKTNTAQIDQRISSKTANNFWTLGIYTALCLCLWEKQILGIFFRYEGEVLWKQWKRIWFTLLVMTRIIDLKVIPNLESAALHIPLCIIKPIFRYVV